MEIYAFTFVPAPEEVVEEVDIPVERPTFEKNPVLTVHPSNETYSLRCTFEPLTSTDNIMYKYTVQYYHNNTVFTTQDMGNDTYVAEIDAVDIGVGKYGDEIRCAVSACHYDDCENTKGPERKSEEFKLDVKILTEKIKVYEGLNGECIKIQASVPPSTFCNPSENCVLQIGYQFTDSKAHQRCSDGNSIPQAAFETSDVNSPCQLTITRENWQDEMCVFVRAVADGLKDKDKDLHVSISVTVKSTVVISQTTLSAVEVEVIDRDKSLICKSTGDPHIRTFGGRTYDNYREGEFLLYKHKTLPYEVRTLQRDCNGFAACNSGVAIRFGDDVLTLDTRGAKRKRNKRRPLKRKLYLNNGLTQGVAIIKYNNGKSYRIILPTGTEIRVQTRRRKKRNYSVMDVFIRPSSADLDQTEGLCGIFTGEKSNDLVMSDGTYYPGKSRKVPEFCLSWRTDTLGLPSLWKGYCPDNLGEALTILPTYCDCHTSGNECYDNIETLACPHWKKGKSKGKKWKKAKDVTEIMVSKAISPPPRCLSTTVEVYEFNLTYVSPPTVTVTVSGRTPESAFQECKNLIEASPGFQACKNIEDIDLVSALSSCAEDLMVTDDPDWAMDTLNTLVVKCQITLEFNVELWVEVNGVFVPNPAIVDNTCDEDCSGNGNCVEGECVCNQGYSGDDCSIDDNAVIPVEPFEEPFCDANDKACPTVTIFADFFLETSVIQCALQRMQKTTVFVAVGEEIIVNATYESRETVTCTLPDSDVYQITIINNFVRTTESLLYIIYDPLCYTCTTGGCEPRDDVCIFGGNCYRSGFFDLFNPGQGCIPSTKTDGWTMITSLDITVTLMTFIRIEGTILITPSISITIVGSPSLISIPSGEMAIELDGNSYLNIGDQSQTCIGNPLERCKFGMTVGFQLKVITITENTYIFTTGGDQSDGYGVAMYYRRNQLFLTVSTQTMEWTVFTSVKLNVFINIEFTWSIQSGLKLYFDGSVVAQTTAFVSRNVTVSAYTTAYIGVGFSFNIKANIVITGWRITDATRDTIDSVTTESTTEMTTEFTTTEMTTEATTTEMSTTTEVSTTSAVPTTTGEITTSKETTPTEGTTTMETTTEIPTKLTTTQPEYTTTTAVPETTTAEATTTAKATITPKATTPEATTKTVETTTSSSGCFGESGSYPALTSNPITLTASSNTGQSSVSYTCQIVPSTESGAEHTIVWYIGTDQLKEVTLSSGDNSDVVLSTTLTGSQRTTALSDGVTCGVYVSNPQRCGDGVSPIVNSTTTTQFNLRANVPDTMTLVEGDASLSYQITVSSNINIYCAIEYGRPCTVLVKAEIVVPTPKKKCFDGNDIDKISIESDDSDLETATCGVVLTPTQTDYSLKFKARMDKILYRNPTNRSINIVQIDTPSGSAEVKKILKTVQVTVEETRFLSQCHLTGDPHILTFDRKRFDCYLQGEFVAYRNTDINKYQTEVRTQFTGCQRGSCVCGVLIKVGECLLKIDKCALPRDGTAFPITTSTDCRNPNQTVNNFLIYQEWAGKKFKIILQTTGMVITIIDQHDVYLDVFLEPSANDFSKTEGLCGSYNGDKSDDLTDSSGVVHQVVNHRADSFAATWKVADADSIYEGNLPAVTIPTPIFCVCFTDGTKKCGYFNDIEMCGVTKNGTNLTPSLRSQERKDKQNRALQQSGQRRKKRAIESAPFTYDPNANAPLTFTWPTASGITQAAATAECNKAKTSLAGVECTSILDDDFTDYVDNCVSDVYLTDSLAWLAPIISTIKERCTTFVQNNESLWIDPVVGDTPSLPTNIVNNVCLNDCKNNGVCNDGICSCNVNSFGPDCSISDNDKPIILASYSNDVCDVSTLDCNEIPIYGTKFIDSPTVTCHLTEVTVGANGITSTLGTQTVSAIYRSINNVFCPNPDKKTVLVAVSNDGQNPSTERSIFVTYTSNCYICTEDSTQPTATCTTNLANSCLINSVCYVSGDKQPGDTCFQCNPSNSKDVWSRVVGPGCEEVVPVDNTEMNAVTVIAVSVSIAVIVLIAIAVAAVCVIRRNRLRKENLESLSGDSEREYRSKVPPGPQYPPYNWNYMYDHPTNSSVYRPQRIAFYDNRAAMDDYFED